MEFVILEVRVLRFLLETHIRLGDSVYLLLSEIKDLLNCHLSEAGLVAIPAISVAMLLPIAIFLAEKNSDPMYSFDKNVIFRKIFHYKFFISVILINSFVLLFDIKILSLFCAIMTLIITGMLLMRAYKWFCSYEETNYKMTFRQMLRIQFLSSLNDVDEILETWNMILADKELSEKNQNGLIDVFIETSNKLPETLDDFSRSTLLRMLSQNIDKINFNNIKTFKTLLIYSEEYYRQEKSYREDYGTLPITELKSIFMWLLRFAISDNNDYSKTYKYAFFDEIERFSKEIGAADFDKVFLRDLLHELEKIEVDVFDLWNFSGEYLKNIVVTRSRLEEKSLGHLTSIIFGIYIDYALYHIQRYDDLPIKTRRALEKTTECILKEADPVFWFDMMTFCHRSFGQYPGKDTYCSMIMSWCINGRNYGESGRAQVFNNDIDIRNIDTWEKELNYKMEEKRRDETMEAAFLVGCVDKWLWNPKECEKILKGIDAVEAEEVFQANSTEYIRLMQLRQRFSQMLEFIGNEEKKTIKEKPKT